MNPLNMRKSLLAVTLLAGFAFGLVVSGRMAMTESSGAAPASPPPAQATLATTPAAAAGLPDLSPIADRALKVSTNISSTQLVRRRTDPFYQFFYGAEPWATQESTSLGSGVIVSADGYVLTNNHVIGDAGSDIRVTLPDGRELKGAVVGVDDVTDLAVLKVDAQGLPTLPWGDSTRLRVAEWVLAIGNPFQFSRTVTLGIVSAVSRSGEQVGAYNDLIQTDAAINPGNSGGALVNGRGELVGINSMIYSETGGYQGIGFAIPSNVAREIMDELKKGEVHWGSVGVVRWLTIDENTARRAGFGPVAGAYVDRISRNASAYKAGLLPDDIVVSFKGQTITSAEQLDRLIIGTTPGTTADVGVMRNGRRINLAVPIVSRQQQPSGR
jgi:serine protease Do